MTNYVKDIWEDSEGFVVVLSNGVWTTWYHIKISELDNGGSLSAAFNRRNKETLFHSKLRVDRDSLMAATVEAKQKLRPIVEDFFYRRDILTTEQKTEDD